MILLTCAACGRKRLEHEPLDLDALGLENWFSFVGGRWACRYSCLRVLIERRQSERDAEFCRARRSDRWIP